MDKAAEAEFRDFVNSRSGELIRRAYVLVGGDYDAAEDLVQTALAKAADRWRSIDDPIAYVRAIMYRQQISWWRRGWSRLETPSAEMPERAGVDSTDTTEVKVAVRAALARLTPRQRAMLFLRYFEDLPEADVAATLGCSVGNVRSTCHRALAKLRVVAPDLADLGVGGRHHPSSTRPPTTKVPS